jgi:hypothetical protein
MTSMIFGTGSAGAGFGVLIRIPAKRNPCAFVITSTSTEVGLVDSRTEMATAVQEYARMFDRLTWKRQYANIGII